MRHFPALPSRHEATMLICPMSEQVTSPQSPSANGWRKLDEWIPLGRCARAEQLDGGWPLSDRSRHLRRLYRRAKFSSRMEHRLPFVGVPVMRLTIRPAVSEDESSVVELWHACDLVASYNDPAADFRFARASACSDVLVGEDETGRTSGSVMVGHDGHRGWLYYVACAPGLRGSGIGRQMVQAAEEWLRQRGVVKVQLLVRETNTQVVSFYEHLGYEVAPRVVMGKWLGLPA